MKTQATYSPSLWERVVRMVLTSEHEPPARWATIKSVVAKMGCTVETLRSWSNKMEVDTGVKPGVSSDQAEKLKSLERKNRELKRANEILRKAAAFFAQAELGRRPK